MIISRNKVSYSPAAAAAAAAAKLLMFHIHILLRIENQISTDIIKR